MSETSKHPSAFAELGLAKTVKVLSEEIRELYLCDAVPWVVGYSGGKDSSAVLQLVWLAIRELPREQRKKPIHVITTDTLVEQPLVAAWVDTSQARMREAAPEQGLPITPHKLMPEIEDSFWVNLIGKGYPAPRPKFRWCTERLKIRPSNKFIREVVRQNGEAILVLGTRKAESQRRAATMAKHEARRVRERLSPNSSLPNSLVYSPIEDWTNDDVWLYLADVIQRLLVERDQQLIEVVRAARATSALLARVTQHLAADRASRQHAGSVGRRLDLSEAARSLLRQLRGSKLTAMEKEAEELLEKHARISREREELERAIAATPDDADIHAILEPLKKATQEFTLLEEQAKQLDAAIETDKAKLQEAAAKLEKLLEGRMEKEFAHEDARRMMELAGRTRETMQAFLTRVTERKIDRLSALISESFRFLLRKQTLVERIFIDPATFAITLYDTEGQAIAKQRLSEGEKQIFAISVLWGLARPSARPLPAVIDTPMARLDAAHRQHLVERYFPNASHQVIIFSTDTEVDRKYYEELQPHIARAYHLNYDERERRTVGEEGYFWKES